MEQEREHSDDLIDLESRLRELSPVPAQLDTAAYAVFGGPAIGITSKKLLADYLAPGDCWPDRCLPDDGISADGNTEPPNCLRTAGTSC